MVLDAALLNTQHYNLRINGEEEQCQGVEWHPPILYAVVAVESGALGSPTTGVANLYIYIYISFYSFFNKKN